MYGRRHTLACEIAQDDQPAHLSLLLEELCKSTANEQEHATPLIITPHISDEARHLCKQSKAGFLDLEGNACIALGEVFILKRTIPHTMRRSVTHQPAQPAAHNTAA